MADLCWTDLSDADRCEVDRLLLADQTILAMKYIREAHQVDLRWAILIVLGRKAEIVPPRPLPTVEDLEQSARAAIGGAPSQVSAHWDGDSEGWFVVLEALATGGQPLWRVFLRGPGGDMRLFNGRVPPWPEAELARAAGANLAAMWGVPFVFDETDGPRG